MVLLLLAIAGGLFAQTVTWFGYVREVVTPLQGDFDNDPTMAWGDNARVGARFTNEDKTAGASFRIGSGGNGASVAADYAYAWWRPIEQLYVRFGKIDQEAIYWRDRGIIHWGLHANDVNDVNLRPQFDWNEFAGNVAPSGIGCIAPDYLGNRQTVQLSILPMDGLYATFVMPVGEINGKGVRILSEDMLRRFMAEVTYSIPGAGQASIQYANSDDKDATINNPWTFDPETGAGKAPTQATSNNRPANRLLSFIYGQPIGEMSIIAAVQLPIPVDGDMNHIDVGVGFGTGSKLGALRINARVGAVIGFNGNDNQKIGLDIVPKYEIASGLNFYLPVGFGIHVPPVGDTLFYWNVGPYITKALGGGNLFTGCVFYNGKGADKDTVYYRVPIAMIFSF